MCEMSSLNLLKHRSSYHHYILKKCFIINDFLQKCISKSLIFVSLYAAKYSNLICVMCVINE